ncbi:isocitrate/isopropylmalate family dehydrogenase, partial [Falsiroseomonas sp.]
MPTNAMRVAVMPGDGIGVEVTDATTFVLEKLVRRHGLGLSTETLAAGAFVYQETGTAMSEEVF